VWAKRTFTGDGQVGSGKVHGGLAFEPGSLQGMIQAGNFTRKSTPAVGVQISR
jgi:hypothetical protein